MAGKNRAVTLKEIARRINAHLQRFEADPKVNRYPKGHPCTAAGLHPYYRAGAHAAGSWVRVCYIAYQGASPLRRGDALAYLEWLDAGHVGRHFEQQWDARLPKALEAHAPAACGAERGEGEG